MSAIRFAAPRPFWDALAPQPGAELADELANAMSEATRTPRILFVDSNPEHANAVSAEAGERLALVPCADAAAAAAALSQSLDAVLLSLDLSAEEATNVVAEVERRFPGLPLIGCATRLSDTNIAMACHLGAVCLLTAPVGVEALLTALEQPPADAGFSGTCTEVPTAQLLTLHCESGADGILHFACPATATRPERLGSIFLEAGQPVHATAGETSGADAVHAILTWVDAEATWLPGVARTARTIVGRWEGLLARAVGRRIDNAEDVERLVTVAYPEVVEKLSRLCQTPDVLGAFLLRHAEVVHGRCNPGIDEDLANRALCRLAHVYFDVDAQPNEDAGREIQAIVGTMRLVLDRLGPPSAGFQVGVLVRQAAPICKSLRRLLRQIDGAFARAARGRARASHNRGDVVARVA